MEKKYANLAINILSKVGLTRVVSTIKLYVKFILPYVEKNGAFHLKGSHLSTAMFKNPQSLKNLHSVKNDELSIRNKKFDFISHFHFLHSVITYNRGQDDEFKLSSTVILDRSKFSKTFPHPSVTQFHNLEDIISKDFDEVIRKDKTKIDQNILWNLNNLNGGKTKLLYKICLENRFINPLFD